MMWTVYKRTRQTVEAKTVSGDDSVEKTVSGDDSVEKTVSGDDSVEKTVNGAYNAEMKKTMSVDDSGCLLVA